MVLRFWAVCAALVACATGAFAGNFSFNWGTAPYTWTANNLGPATYTLTDQYGFQLQARFTITQANGVSAGAYPDDLLASGGNQFGTQTSIWQVWNPNLTGGSIGGSTNVLTMEILNAGTAFGVNGLTFRASDIDAVDNNTNPPTNDRCDHLTFTGNAGNPSLTAVTGSPTFRIGPGAGSGSSPALASNQVQCIFNTSIAVASPTSNGDDTGTLQVTYPNGTHTSTIRYDESVHNVYNNFTFNAAARGVGTWAATAFSVNNTITLDKTTTSTSYTAAGQVIPYTFTVTNNGPLPILTSQNIQISDSKIGLITCPAIPAAGIAVGATHVCTANYTVLAADVTAAGGITNSAIAGVGTGAMAFASRLQSNTDIVNVPNRVIDAVNNTFTGTAINGTSGGTTASVFTNDTLGAVSFADTAVVPTITATGGLTGVTINSNGTLSVPPGTTAGTYTVTYRICDAAAPAVCDTATATVLVSVTPPGGSATLCSGTNLATNGGIESPVITAGGQAQLAVNAVPGWSTNDNAIEIWSSGFNGVPSHTGAQFLEMNANIGTSILTQTPSAIRPRAEIRVLWAHRGRAGTDTARTILTDNGGGTITSANYSTGNTAWSQQSLTYVSSATASSMTVQFDSISSAGGASLGNFIDTVQVCQTYMTITKSYVSRMDVDSSGSDTAGDTVLYQFAISNPAGNERSLTTVSVVDNKIGTISVATPDSGDTNTNGFLDPGETWIKTASYTLLQVDINTTSVTNVAYAQGSTGVNTIRSPDANVTVPLTAAPVLALAKSYVFLVDAGTPGQADAGDVIRYTYLVTNNGNLPINNVSVTDIHNGNNTFPTNPPGANLSDTAPLGDSSGTTGSATWSVLAPKDSVTFTADYTVNQVDIETLQ